MQPPRRHNGSLYLLAAALVLALAQLAIIGSALRDTWPSPGVLGLLCAASVVIVVALLYRTGADSARRRRAQRSLRESEEKLASIIDTASEAVIVSDHDGVITLWNKASERIFGHSAAEALGQKIRLIVPHRFREAHEAGMRRLAVHGSERSGQLLDLTALRKDGSEFPSELSFTVRGTGENRFITGIVRDVTERKRAEAALRESEQRFRSAFDDTGVGMVLTELDGRFVRANRAFCRMIGYSEQELFTRTVRDITHPDDVAKSIEVVRTMIEGECSDFTLEKRYIHRDGHTVWAHTSAAIVRDAAGTAQHLVGEIQDISERKRTEQALRESEERFRSIFENAGIGMHTAAPDGRFLQVNPTFCRFLGYTEQEFLGLTISDITHPDDLPETAAYLAEVQAGRPKVINLVKRLIRKDGTVVWGNVTAVWLPDTENHPAYLVCMIQDVTEQRQAEQRLLGAKEHLERSITERTADLVAANRQLTTEIADRKRAEAIQSGWNRVLQRLAADAPLAEILTVLVEVVEDVQPRTICSVLLLDQDTKRLRLGAAPSLPDFYNEAVDGLEIGPGAGSCGTAAFTGERVIVEDVTTHPYWAPYRDVARRAGLGACWSEPIRSSNGEILGTFAIYYRESRAPDQPAITLIVSAAHLAGIAIERKQAEDRLAESRERLRLSDRLASLGTLVAGLGHDMNNVLFPLRCRLDALNWDDLPEDVREVIKSARDSVDYLQQLSSGLRLFAADPLATDSTLEITSPAAWWGQVQPLISKMVQKNITIHAEIPDDLPLVTVAAHRLTQAVMNLVTNAAEAMPAGGEIHIRANVDQSRHVVITVSDKGIGMSEEVRRRALDPFFTTKKRSLSTGLGLSLVVGVVRRSHGAITIDSAPGKGTTVRLAFPAARVTGATRRRRNGEQDRATVTLRDQRTAAWVTNILESVGYSVSVAEDGDPRQSDIWVTDASTKNLSMARSFLTRHDQRRIIVMGSADEAWTGLGAVVVQDTSNLDDIKSAVCEVTPVSP